MNRAKLIKLKILLLIQIFKSLRILNVFPYTYILKDLLLKFLPKLKDINVKVDQINYVFDSSNYHERCLLTDGEYEKETIDFLKDYLKSKKNGFFIDVGAHNGQISLPIAKHISPFNNVMVLAFEPLKMIHKRLENNILINGVDSFLQSYNLGCHDKNCIQKLYVPKSKNNYINYGISTTDFQIAKSRSIENDFQEINLVKLDDFFYKELEINKGKIHACKIDVEGSELFVLRGMKRIIEEYYPAFIIEYNSVNFQEIKSFLGYYNYKLIGSLQKFGISKNSIEKNLLFLKN
tara:strand:- start:450 stop:1325 length:876 start_codon:yes stop_codon:yes gene_type:complete